MHIRSTSGHFGLQLIDRVFWEVGSSGGEGVLIFWCYRKQHVQAAAFNIVSEMVVTIKFLLNILFFAVFYLHNTL